MNKLTNVDYLKNYLRSHNFKPRDYMGQNFLIDEEVLAKIISVSELKSSDVVLEVGPGLGVLTQELLPRVKQVIAVEKDQKLLEILKLQFFPSPLWGEVPYLTGRRGLIKGGGSQESPPPNLPHSGGGTTPRNNLILINQDILRFNLSEHIQEPYKVVANIPYYLTSKLFQYLLEQKNKPTLIVLMIQKEVGERVVASAGDLSVLGISVQIYADVEIAASVSKTSFWPVPKVDSVVLKITPKNKYPEIQDRKLFFRIIKMAFSGKRKQIQNSLSHGLQISKEVVGDLLVRSEIKPSDRPQDLSIKQWIRLYITIGLAKK